MSTPAQLPPSTVRAAGMRPLVMRCGAFGDMVLLTVLLRQLQLRFGQPVDLISSGPWTAPLLECESAVGRLFILRSRRTPYWLSRRQRQLVAWLRARGTGPTWFCDRGEGLGLLSRAGIPDDYICNTNAYTWDKGESLADRYIRLGSFTPRAFEGLLPPAKPGVPRAAHLDVAPGARQELAAWLARRGLTGRQFVVVHAGSAHIARRWLRPRSATDRYWPEERWAKVVTAVRAHCPQHAILLSGTRAEGRFNAAIIAQAQVTDAYNIASELSVRTLLALLERAQSMISIDTGPAHAAAALGCPTVGIFGAQNPHLYRPGGATTPAVSLTGMVAGKQSILGITPEAVIDAWLELLKAPSVRSARI